MIRHHAIRTGLVFLAACGTGGSKTTFPGGETIAFYGILVDVPAETSSASSGSHRPMNYEGAPTEVTPGITFIHPNTNDMYVEIKKLPAPVSLEGMKYSFEQQPRASRLTGRTTARGWDFEYGWKNDGAPVATVYVRYVQLGSEQYECQYDDGNSKQLDVADKICRSIRPKPAAK
ncbi:MAG TPA: hypothetical protein VNO30_00695 [Kofleriaceae bacterium]|nr:hypothetical protein [Kofleriaceae bacterium]